MDDQDFRVLLRIATALERIADRLDKICDPETNTLRMEDVERAKVYSTHLGGKLKSDG